MPYTLFDFKNVFFSELSFLYDKQETGALFRFVMEDVFGYLPADIPLHINQMIPEHQIIKLKNILSRLKVAEPIQYISGKADFYNLQFAVDPSVLIPRQETEIMVDLLIKKYCDNQQIKILDIGTGSGCIAITLKKNLPESAIYAMDISEKALQIAQSNAHMNDVEIKFIKSDILHPDAINSDSFDLIVSNPPYVRKTEKSWMHQNVTEFEPEIALYVEDEEPLVFYEAIMKYSSLALKRNGAIALEINEAFGKELKTMVENHGYTQVHIYKDLNYKDRFITGIKT